MKDYNPVLMMLNMPCQYIELDRDNSKNFSTEVLVGHFAFYDEDGYGYVWSGGGTSYTRATSFISAASSIKEYADAQLKIGGLIKCRYVFPMTENVHEYIKHKQVLGLVNSKKTPV